MKSHLRSMVAITLVGGMLQGAAWSQPAAGNTTTNSTLPALPAPKKDLPPLQLPEIPGEEMRPEDKEPSNEPPAWEDKNKEQQATPPPAPLPIPAGPAVVDANLVPKRKAIFRVEYDKRLVGYSVFEVSGRMSLVGESSWILKSRSRLKLGVGSKDDSNFESKLMVDTKTLEPT